MLHPRRGFLAGEVDALAGARRPACAVELVRRLDEEAFEALIACKVGSCRCSARRPLRMRTLAARWRCRAPARALDLVGLQIGQRAQRLVDSPSAAFREQGRPRVDLARLQLRRAGSAAAGRRRCRCRQGGPQAWEACRGVRHRQQLPGRRTAGDDRAGAVQGQLDGRRSRRVTAAAKWSSIQMSVPRPCPPSRPPGDSWFMTIACAWPPPRRRLPSPRPAPMAGTGPSRRAAAFDAWFAALDPHLLRPAPYATLSHRRRPTPASAATPRSGPRVRNRIVMDAPPPPPGRAARSSRIAGLILPGRAACAPHAGRRRGAGASCCSTDLGNRLYLDACRDPPPQPTRPIQRRARCACCACSWVPADVLPPFRRRCCCSVHVALFPTGAIHQRRFGVAGPDKGAGHQTCDRLVADPTRWRNRWCRAPRLDAAQPDGLQPDQPGILDFQDAVRGRSPTTWPACCATPSSTWDEARGARLEPCAGGNRRATPVLPLGDAFAADFGGVLARPRDGWARRHG